MESNTSNSAQHYKGLVAEVKWQKAEVLINNYNSNGRSIPNTQLPNNPSVSSFIMPLTPFQGLLNNQNTTKAFFGLSYHESMAPGDLTVGYSLILLGIDDTNNILIDEENVRFDAVTNAQIELDFAKEITKIYREKYPIPLKKEEQSLLKGFSFPITEIQLLLGQPNIASVEIIFGYHTTIGPLNEQEGYTLILVGRDSNGSRLISDNNILFDFCDTCPRKCPLNVDFMYF